MNKKPISSKEVFKTKWFSVDAVSYDAGKEPYYRLSCVDSVGMVAVTPDQKIILVKQFRPAIGDYSMEFPAGYMGKNELPEKAVKREFKEETGFVCDSVTYMGSFKGCPARINSSYHLFFGKNAKRVSASTDEEEKCEVILIPKNKFLKMINEGKFTAIGAIGSYFFAQLKGFI